MPGALLVGFYRCYVGVEFCSISESSSLDSVYGAASDSPQQQSFVFSLCRKGLFFMRMLFDPGPWMADPLRNGPVERDVEQVSF